jgi:MFS family permease
VTVPTRPAIPTAPFAAIALQFACFGLGCGLMGGAIPALQRQAGIGTAELGVALTLYMVSALVAMWIAGRLLARLAPRRILVVMLPFQAAALVVLENATGYVGVLVGMAAFALSLSIVDITMNAEVARQEAERGRPIFSFIHGTASVGFAIGLVSGSIVAHGLGLKAVATFGVAAFGLGLAAVALFVHDHPPRPAAERPAGGGGRAGRFGLDLSLLFLVLGGILGVDIATENTAQLWSGRMIEDLFPGFALLSGLGGTFFYAAQAVPRLAGDLVRRRVDDRRLVLASLTLAAFGLLVVGSVPWLPGKLVGLALVGVGTALVVPCSFAIASAARPSAPGEALSTLLVVAGVPRVLVPAGFAAIADASSVAAAFFALGVVMAAMAVLALGLRRLQNR